MTQKPTRPEVVDETLDAADAPENAAPEQEQAEGETLEDLVNERDDLKDKLLRALAEMENLRRRTEREVADARAYGIAGFARDMLTVADNIQRALESLPAELRDNEAIKPFVEGVELTERDFLKTLERHGVRKLVPQGERFDPNLHQAMFEVPDTSVPNGTVVQVVQAGFMIGERVLRPALVGVSKGGPKPGSAESGPAAPADEPKPN